MRKQYESPEFEFFVMNFENVLNQMNDSDPNIPVESGDPGEDE